MFVCGLLYKRGKNRIRKKGRCRVMRKQEMPFHIRCRASEVGRYCLMPGDPGRCEKIAQHFDNPVFISSNREYTVYTG